MIDPDKVRAVVDKAPPLTPAQLDRVRRLVNPAVPAKARAA